MKREQQLVVKINKIIGKIEKTSNREEAYIHLHGVSHMARMIGKRRKLNAELLAASGLLHDLYAYVHDDESDHARHGSSLARKLLKETKLYKKNEIDKVCQAILYHSAKSEKHKPMDEALKDADVLQHYLMEPWRDITKPKSKRQKKLFREFKLHVK